MLATFTILVLVIVALAAIGAGAFGLLLAGVYVILPAAPDDWLFARNAAFVLIWFGMISATLGYALLVRVLA